MATFQFDPEIIYYTFGPHPPALTLDPGDSVVTWTVDSDNGDRNGRTLGRDQRQAGEGLLEYNGVTGPFAVRGAQPGDTLVVHLDEVSLNRSNAFGAVHSHLSFLGDDMMFVGPTGLKPPIEGRAFQWAISPDRSSLSVELPNSAMGHVTIPAHPFLGCLGVAPRWGEVRHTVDAGNHGGNLDCPALGSGCTIHLPVFVPGGLLSFGDAHAAQGDGEIVGGALETSADVAFTVDLIHGQSLRWPRLLTEHWIGTLCSARPVQDALRIAAACMVEWLETEWGYDRWEGLHLLGQVGHFQLCNLVSPNYTVLMKFPRKYLIHSPDQSGRSAGEGDSG